MLIRASKSEQQREGYAGGRAALPEGASVAELQQAGGWKSPTTPGGYIRREAAAHGPLGATPEQGGQVS